jgi:hypothetical protein
MPPEEYPENSPGTRRSPPFRALREKQGLPVDDLHLAVLSREWDFITGTL